MNTYIRSVAWSRGRLNISHCISRQKHMNRDRALHSDRSRRFGAERREKPKLSLSSPIQSNPILRSDLYYSHVYACMKALLSQRKSGFSSNNETNRSFLQYIQGAPRLRLKLIAMITDSFPKRSRGHSSSPILLLLPCHSHLLRP